MSQALHLCWGRHTGQDAMRKLCDSISQPLIEGDCSNVLTLTSVAVGIQVKSYLCDLNQPKVSRTPPIKQLFWS